MSLSCVYGGHECDGCLNCEPDDELITEDGRDLLEVYDRADYEYDCWRDYEYDRMIDSL